jgi:type I restriction enzyme S subunit
MLTPHEIAGESRQALVIGPFGSNLKKVDYRPEGVPLVFVRDIRGGEFSNPRTFVSPEKAEELKGHQAVLGDVLVTKMGAPPGDAAVYNGAGPAVITADCIRLRPALGFNARYIAYAMHSPDVRAQISAITSGVAHQKVSLDRFRHMVRLPIPSLPEQERIVEVLEENFSRLDAGIDYLAAGAERLERLRGSLIDGLVWDAGYPVRKVRDLLREKMRNGHSAPAVTDGSDGVRTLTLTAVTLGRFEDRYTKITTAAPEKVRDMWLEPGDVFVQRSNTPELVGTTRMYEGPSNWAIFPDLLIRLRTSDEVLPPYLALALNSERAQRSLRARAKGLAGSMPKIDQGTIGDTEIPVPSSIDEQRQVVRIAHARQTEVHRVGEALSGAKIRASSLRRSLLSAAFSGRLTGAASDLERVEEIAADMVEAEVPEGVPV